MRFNNWYREWVLNEKVLKERRNKRWKEGKGKEREGERRDARLEGITSAVETKTRHPGSSGDGKGAQGGEQP